MDDNTFKVKIYGPYSETWKIVKLLQFAGVGGFKREQVEDYWNAVDKFEHDYSGNKFAELLLKNVLLRADDVIIRMNEGGTNEM